MEMRVIVCGGRNFTDRSLFTRTLDRYLAEMTEVRIVSGHASGADRMAEAYAEKNHLPLSVFPADWQLFGRAAGPIRNREMLDYAMEETARVIAFWDGESRGTMNMIEQAEKKGVKTQIIFCNRKNKADRES